MIGSIKSLRVSLKTTRRPMPDTGVARLSVGSSYATEIELGEFCRSYVCIWKISDRFCFAMPFHFATIFFVSCGLRFPC